MESFRSISSLPGRLVMRGVLKCLNRHVSLSCLQLCRCLLESARVSEEDGLELFELLLEIVFTNVFEYAFRSNTDYWLFNAYSYTYNPSTRQCDRHVYVRLVDWHLRSFTLAVTICTRLGARHTYLIANCNISNCNISNSNISSNNISNNKCLSRK